MYMMGRRNKLLLTCLVFLVIDLVVVFRMVLNGDGVPPKMDEKQWHMANGNAARNAVGTTAIRNLPDLLWKFTSERCISSYPVIYDGVVYFTDWGGRVYACDLKTGKEIWRFTNPERPDQIWITPAVDDNYVYAAHVDGLLWAIDRKTGKVSWQLRLDDGPSTSGDLTISNGHLYFVVCNRQLVAIDLGTRKVAWQQKLTDEKEHYYAPTINAGKVYAATESHFYIYDDKGQGLMQGIDSYSGSPVFSDGFVYITTPQGVKCMKAEKLDGVWAFDKAPMRITGIPAVSSDSVFIVGRDGQAGNAALTCIDKNTHKERWTYTAKFGGEPPLSVSDPVVSADVAYFCVGDTKKGMLYAIDAKSGKELWTLATGPATDSAISPVDDMLVLSIGGASGRDGSVYVLKKKAPEESQKAENK
jgi:outer membrane protein assembly factor BamB